MKVAIWRGVAAIVVGFGFIYGVLDSAIPLRVGDLGLTLASRTVADGSSRVVAVASGGSAAKAGIAAGDSIDRNPADVGTCVLAAPHPGDFCSMSVVRDGVARRVVLRAAPGETNPWYEQVALTVTRLSFLLMGALLVWKRSDDAAARSLATFFTCFGIAMGPGAYRLHGVWTFTAAAVVVETLFVAGGAAAVRFATVFPAPDERGPRSTLLRVTPFVAVATIALGIARNVMTTAGAHVSALVNVLAAFWVFVAVAVVSALSIAYRRSVGNDRQRLRWVTATFALGLSGLVVYFVGLAFASAPPFLELATLTIVCIPFGLGYVMLRHRLLDITFVINRAVVFAAVSSIVVGIFVILETLLAKYVEASNHITSTVVQLAVALCLGLGARTIHARVDRFVDDVFFRERHDAEAALRAFAYDAPLITDEETLLRRTREKVLRYAQATSADVWLRDGEDTFVSSTDAHGAEPVDENDPAVLAMRSRHVGVDVVQLRSELPGTYAFPMIVRGRLIGTLVCGADAAAGSYAPDERDALEAVAGRSGMRSTGFACAS